MKSVLMFTMSVLAEITFDTISNKYLCLLALFH